MPWRGSSFVRLTQLSNLYVYEQCWLYLLTICLAGLIFVGSDKTEATMKLIDSLPDDSVAVVKDQWQWKAVYRILRVVSE